MAGTAPKLKPPDFGGADDIAAVGAAPKLKEGAVPSAFFVSLGATIGLTERPDGAGPAGEGPPKLNGALAASVVAAELLDATGTSLAEPSTGLLPNENGDGDVAGGAFGAVSAPVCLLTDAPNPPKKFGTPVFEAAVAAVVGTGVDAEAGAGVGAGTAVGARAAGGAKLCTQRDFGISWAFWCKLSTSHSPATTVPSSQQRRGAQQRRGHSLPA